MHMQTIVEILWLKCQLEMSYINNFQSNCYVAREVFETVGSTYLCVFPDMSIAMYTINILVDTTEQWVQH